MPVNRLLVTVFIVMGLCAGVAAIIDMSRFTTVPIAGYSNTALAAIAAVIIGGTSLFGGPRVHPGHGHRRDDPGRPAQRPRDPRGRPVLAEHRHRRDVHRRRGLRPVPARAHLARTRHPRLGTRATTTPATRGRAVAHRRHAPDSGPGSQHTGGDHDEPPGTTHRRGDGGGAARRRSRDPGRGPGRSGRRDRQDHRARERRPEQPVLRRTGVRSPDSGRGDRSDRHAERTRRLHAVLQNQVIEAAAAAAPDGMVIDAVFPTEATPLIAQIIESGIPVATIQQAVVGRGPGHQPRGAAAGHGASWRRMRWPGRSGTRARSSSSTSRPARRAPTTA